MDSKLARYKVTTGNYLVPDQVPGTGMDDWYQVPGTWYGIPGYHFLEYRSAELPTGYPG